MLKKLQIKNIALIDCAEIDFTKGLNVLSGETGSGKSVIIESLNFVLGAKADKTLIRSGQTECFVKAEFDEVDNSNISAVLDEIDVEMDELLIITRKFTIDGKNTIKINGNSVTVGMLKKLTALLVDVHGQSEHFHLLKTTNQLNLIDAVGGDLISSVKNNIQSEYFEYRKVKNDIESLGGDEGQRLTRLDILNYQINEIDSVAMIDGEEEELLDLRKKLMNQERIMNALNSLKSAVSDEGGICDVLSPVLRLIDGVSEYSSDYSELSERLNNVFSEIDDISSVASSLLDDMDFDGVDPNQVENRLELIKSLKKKYGATFAEITAFRQSALDEKGKLEDFDRLYSDLIDKKSLLEKSLFEKYSILSDLRMETSKKFADNVIKQLQELGMPKAQFVVRMLDKPSFSDCKFDSANGFDSLEFFFSANSGEPLKPLAQVISGGEMSRFMLAIKTQTAKVNEVKTFIFDEIDAGISGNVAKVVAEKFAKIAVDTQIVAITHLPQISAMADNNLLILKTESDSSTKTEVKALTKEGKVLEIIRLVGGGKESIAAKSHAMELIENAEAYKKLL